MDWLLVIFATLLSRLAGWMSVGSVDWPVIRSKLAIIGHRDAYGFARLSGWVSPRALAYCRAGRAIPMTAPRYQAARLDGIRADLWSPGQLAELRARRGTWVDGFAPYDSGHHNAWKWNRSFSDSAVRQE